MPERFVPGIDGNFMGFLSKDPEMTVTKEGKHVTNLSVCLNGETIKRNGAVVMGADGYPERAEAWYRTAFFDELAEAVNENLKAQDFIVMPGEQKLTGYFSEDGVKHSRFEWRPTAIKVKRGLELVEIIASKNKK